MILGRIGQYAILLLAILFHSPGLAEEPPKLNSERIEAKFGSYGIDVLENSPHRVSMLYSTHDGQKICRTFAIVRFAENPPSELQASLKKIQAGASLGKTLKEAGFQIVKEYQHIGSIPSGPRFLELARLKEPADLAMSIYNLSVTRENQSYHVATISEIYHPDYLTLAQLKEISPPPLHQPPNIHALKRLYRKKMAVVRP